MFNFFNLFPKCQEHLLGRQFPGHATEDVPIDSVEPLGICVELNVFHLYFVLKDSLFANIFKIYVCVKAGQFNAEPVGGDRSDVDKFLAQTTRNYEGGGWRGPL